MRKKAKTRKHRRYKLNKLYLFRLHHKIIFSLVGVVGVILVWRGVWTFFDNTPLLSDPVVSIIIGFLLVAFSGLFFKLL